jgi:hypothetical protein
MTSSEKNKIMLEDGLGKVEHRQKKNFTRKWFEQRLRRNAIRAQQNLDEVARQLEHMKFERNYHRSNKNGADESVAIYQQKNQDLREENKHLREEIEQLRLMIRDLRDDICSKPS